MGTAFDAFTPLSHHGRTDVSAEAQRNRLLLMGLMTAAGWDFYRNEWWHYQLFDARRYPLVSRRRPAAADDVTGSSETPRASPCRSRCRSFSRMIWRTNCT